MSNAATGWKAHATALVETDQIGDGTRIWAYAHVMPNARIGERCNIGDHCFIESGAVLGNGVTVKNGVCIWEGVTLGDYVFVGPCAAFTNDRNPRSPRHPLVAPRYHDKGWLSPTRVEEGVAIGANATILCGITLGKYCLVAAGSVVTRDVPPFRVVRGNPARVAGVVDVRGNILKEEGGLWTHAESGKRYRFEGDALVEVPGR